MIRITKTEERSRTVVAIDGDLSVDSIEVVETFCSQAESKAKPVQLYLRDITIVDQAGRMLLSRLAARGVRLVASGVYNTYLVQTLTSLQEHVGIGRLACRRGAARAARRTR